MQQEWTDFVEDFIQWSSDAWSPEIFCKWSAIAMIAAALERRVWALISQRKTMITYPNLYILLVGTPGVGKQIIQDVAELMGEIPAEGPEGPPLFHLAKDSVTKASFVDDLKASDKTWIGPDGTFTYHPIFFCQEEFQVLLPIYDTSMISTLNKLYNNPPGHTESRRTGKVTDLSIPFPSINILAGVQPAYFTATFPEEAWKTGLARRVIMIYSGATPFRPLFSTSSFDPSGLRARITRQLSRIGRLWGQMKWAEAATKRLGAWHEAGFRETGLPSGGPPIPQHSKLAGGYNRSRVMFVTKLSIISAISRTGEFVIELVDVERAIGWLVEAEATMPDVFREMQGKSDQSVLEELHRFVQATWVRLGAKREKTVSSKLIYEFIAQYVPSDKIERIIMVAERADWIQKQSDEGYLPRPKYQLKGVE